MKKLTLLSVMAMLCLCFGGKLYAQTSADTKQALQIGQQVPPIEWKTLLNYDSPTILLKDLQGKIVILDFWSTWCGPCVRSLPKLHTLQKAFKDDVQILLVTKDSEGSIAKFFAVNPYAKGTTPTIVQRNTITNQLFPFIYIPHLVWLNRNGQIIAITHGDDLTKENLSNAIAGKPFPFTLKQDSKPKNAN